MLFAGGNCDVKRINLFFTSADFAKGNIVSADFRFFVKGQLFIKNIVRIIAAVKEVLLSAVAGCGYRVVAARN